LAADVADASRQPEEDTERRTPDASLKRTLKDGRQMPDARRQPEKDTERRTPDASLKRTLKDGRQTPA